jgi:protein-L-isoaspartate(D-aspartate) O-methyltransferase
MLVSLLRDQRLRKPRLAWALLRVPRAPFVPSSDPEAVYGTAGAESACGQTVTDARFVALMVAAVDPHPVERVLEVGTGTGYQAAILASMGCRVTTIERHAELHSIAQSNLRALGLRSVDCRRGDGSHGVPDGAPFDVIIVSCAAPEPPEALLSQLSPGGRLILPEGDPDAMQTLTLYTKTPSGLERVPLRAAWFVPLVRSEG